MHKGEWVRRFAVGVAILLLITGQWPMLLLGASCYHLARWSVQALEHRSDRPGRSRVPDAPLV